MSTVPEQTRIRPRKSPNRRRRLLAGLWIVNGALVVAGLVIVAAIVTAPTGPKDLLGQTVAAPGVLPGTSTVTAMHAVSDTGKRLAVPSRKLDVPLGALDTADGTIAPPGFAAAYRVRTLGVAPDHAAEGSVYVIMHSLRGSKVGPGNALVDPETGRAQVKAGDAVALAGVSYTVTASETLSQTALNSSPVWQSTPGTLILFVSLQAPSGGPSGDVFVVTAHLDA